MLFEKQVVTGKLVKRYKRFFADVILENGELVTAHCPNTGSMKTCGDPGDVVLLTFNDNPKRKLKYTWELTQFGKTYVGVNTALPNHVVKEALIQKQIPEVAEYSEIRCEVKYGQKSRIDFLLTEPTLPDCYLEVKNVTLAQDGTALFPDAVTSRGLRHLQELVQIAEGGQRAVMFYLVNRNDVRKFLPAWQIDQKYCEGLLVAQQAGVEILAYQTKASATGIWIDRPIPIQLTL